MQILVSINDNLTHKKGHSLTLDLVQSSFLALCTVGSGRVATDNRQRDCRTPGMDPSSYSWELTLLPPATQASMNIESEISVLHNFPSSRACRSAVQNNGQLDYTFQANRTDSLPEQIWGVCWFYGKRLWHEEGNGKVDGQSGKKRSRLTLASRGRQCSGVKCCSGGGGSCVPWHPLLVKGHDGEGGVLAKVEKENDKSDWDGGIRRSPLSGRNPFDFDLAPAKRSMVQRVGLFWATIGSL